MVDNFTGFDNDDENPLCALYETYTLSRFIFICAATLIACLGTIGNILLAYIFCSKKTTTTPPTLYPTLLALLDFAICFEYILLFGVDAIVSYVKIESLFILYYLYIIPAYVLSRITQLAIPYMLIFATLERLVWTYHNVQNRYLKAIYSTSGRYFTVIITVSICVALRLPTAFAMHVGIYPQCPDFFRTMTTQPRDWVKSSDGYHYFDFYIMTIAQTLVPFIILLALNMIIVRKVNNEIVRKTTQPLIVPPSPSVRSMTLGEDSPKSRKVSALGISLQPLKALSSSVKSAIYTMAAIVTSYLISNVLHLILTILERSEHPWLFSDEDPLLSSSFHTIFSDLVSFVYMFTSAIRLLIYYGCNPAIRKDIKEFLSRRMSDDVVYV